MPECATLTAHWDGLGRGYALDAATGDAKDPRRAPLAGLMAKR